MKRDNRMGKYACAAGIEPLFHVTESRTPLRIALSQHGTLHTLNHAGNHPQ